MIFIFFGWTLIRQLTILAFLLEIRTVILRFFHLLFNFFLNILFRRNAGFFVLHQLIHILLSIFRSQHLEWQVSLLLLDRLCQFLGFSIIVFRIWVNSVPSYWRLVKLNNVGSLLLSLISSYVALIASIHRRSIPVGKLRWLF